MSRGDVTLLAGTAGAAGAALPGQPPYPIKRVVDRAMVAIAGDGAEAARLDLRFAERRLDESAAVAGQADDLATAISDRFDAHLNAAPRLAGDDVAEQVERLERSRRHTAEGRPESVRTGQRGGAERAGRRHRCRTYRLALSTSRP